MHKQFGRYSGTEHKTCKECNNLNRYLYKGKKYKKCSVYGESHSEATDWNVSFEACGMFNCDFNGNPLIDILRCRGNVQPEEQLPGQISVDEWLATS